MRRLLTFVAALAWTLTSVLIAPHVQAAPRGIYCDGHNESRLPVLLVHGYNSGPETWSGVSRNQLSRAGSATCIDVFDYKYRSTYWVTNEAIGPALATRIIQLADASERGGGLGQVVVVAHSMGGLATRCAAAASCNGRQGNLADKIAELITFGTPNLGSFLAQRNNAVASLISAHCLLTTFSTPDFCDPVRALFTSEASRAFEPGSPEEAALPDLPPGVPVYALAARINVQSSFFGLNRADVGDGGDLVVLRESALANAERVGPLGGSQTIDCGFVDITDLPRSRRSCWHGSLTNDSRFLEAAAHQIDLVDTQTMQRAPTAEEVENGVIPAGYCGDGMTGWEQPVPIMLHDGEGSARLADGSFGGSSIKDAEVIGFVDTGGEAGEAAVLQFTCFGSLPENCCAGRTSILTFVAVLVREPSGALQLVGQVIRGGATVPGDEFGPADRGIRSASIDRNVVVTTEYIHYPEQYTAAQVGGDPFAPVSVRHTFENGEWIDS